MASPRLTEPIVHGVGQAGKGAAAGVTDGEAIREQLERILGSAVFRNSKRNSSLLRHVVEQTLQGRTEELKERSIGVDVFCRVADYDTNTDHVVRSVAGEVRRRLAQYYMEPGRESEPRIDLVAGSYVPQFRVPREKRALVPAPEVPKAVEIPRALSAPGWTERFLHLRWIVVAVAGLLIVGAGSLLALRFTGPGTASAKFWNPFFASSTPALLCLGGGGTANPASAENMALSIWPRAARSPITRGRTPA